MEVQTKKSRTMESLLGLLGCFLGIVGLGIHSVSTLMHAGDAREWGMVFLHWLMIAYLIFAVSMSTPEQIQWDHKRSATALFVGGVASLFFSWFMAIAGVLMLAGGLLALRRDPIQEKQQG
jgi:uncharacterized membrane protein YjfL (UPF0719 family)